MACALSWNVSRGVGVQVRLARPCRDVPDCGSVKPRLDASISSQKALPLSWISQRLAERAVGDELEPARAALAEVLEGGQEDAAADVAGDFGDASELSR
jgi:hypothetical protein